MNSSMDEIRQEMEEIAEKAYECYKLQQIEQALSLYRKAYDAALIIEEREKMAKYRQWEGHCLGQLGRIREALTVMPSLSEAANIMPHEYLSSIVDQIDNAIKLPLELYKIERLINLAYEVMRQHGLQSSRSMILIQESVLAFMRYDYELSLEKSLESLDSYDQGAKANFNIMVCYRNIINNMIALERVGDLREWINRLDELNTTLPIMREFCMLGFLAELAKLEYRFNEAYVFAEKRLLLERKTSSDCFTSLRLLIRMGIFAKKLDIIKDYVDEFASLRHIKYLNWQYQIELYSGDYNFALFQRELKNINSSRSQLDWYIKHTEQFYAQATSIGETVDNLFNCNGRHKEVKMRVSDASIQA